MRSCGFQGRGRTHWRLGLIRGVAALAGAVVVAVGAMAVAGYKADQPEPAVAPEPVDANVLGFTLNDIDGKPHNLEQYKGKVVLIVNVASRCGYTRQYDGLQKLYTDKKEAGLVVLGFPSNDFGNQEPGTNEEIKEFCSSKYGVSFPMFSKIGVSGEQAHPLYKKLAAQPAPVGGFPQWNFTKFLVDRSGKVVARYESRAKPDDPQFLKRIDDLLEAK
jgi:glutathione peroxidase